MCTPNVCSRVEKMPVGQGMNRFHQLQAVTVKLNWKMADAICLAKYLHLAVSRCKSAQHANMSPLLYYPQSFAQNNFVRAQNSGHLLFFYIRTRKSSFVHTMDARRCYQIMDTHKLSTGLADEVFDRTGWSFTYLAKFHTQAWIACRTQARPNSRVQYIDLVRRESHTVAHWFLLLPVWPGGGRFVTNTEWLASDAFDRITPSKLSRHQIESNVE